jgi:Holliday junction DNA helicase RuvB
MLRRVPDLIDVLFCQEGPGVLFIDEVHRMPSAVEQVLYEALEDGTVTGETAGKRISLKLPPLAVIGATTEPRALSTQLRDRFGVQLTVEPRSPDELTSLVRRVWDRAELAYEDGAARLIA